MEQDRAVYQSLDELLGSELQDEGHDADFGVRYLHRLHRLGSLQRLELVNLEALVLRRDTQRIGPGAILLLGAEDCRDLVAARQEGLEHGLSVILLSDDRDLLLAFFGGWLKAPDLFR